MPPAADINFYFDPVCPFAWMTSKWVRMVQRQRDYTVEWRFISLRLINAGVDYASQFPPEYEAGHTAGLRLLRVAAATRERHGGEAVGRLYQRYGSHIFDADPVDEDDPTQDRRGTAGFVAPILSEAMLPADLVAALDDDSFDAQIRCESDEALALTGKDVGTPIIHFRPPEGVAFFGPVISRLPGEDDAATLWDHVVALAGFDGFSELKRSLRERPQLRSFGVGQGDTGQQEDWHGGSRRQHK